MRGTRIPARQPGGERYGDAPSRHTGEREGGDTMTAIFDGWMAAIVAAGSVGFVCGMLVAYCLRRGAE